MRTVRNRAAFLYLVAASLNAAIPFFTLPFLTKVLTPNDFGIIAGFVSLTTIAATFVRFELNTVVKKVFAQSPELLARVFGTVLSYGGVLIVVGLSIVSLLYFGDAEFLGLDGALWICVVVVAVSRLPTLTLHNYWHVARNVNPYVSWSVLALGGTHFLTLFLALTLLPDWRARVTMDLFVALTSLGVTLVIMRRRHNVVPIWDSKIVGRVVKIAAPIWPGALVVTILFSIDRIVLLNLVSKHDLGIYSVGMQFAAVITLLFTALNPPFEAWAYENLKAGKPGLRGLFLKRFAVIAFAGFGAAGVAAPILMLLLPYWVAPNFVAASTLIPPLMIALTLFGIFRMMNVCLISLDRLVTSSVLSGIALVINTSTLVMLVPLFGINGAAYGLALGFGLAAIIQLFIILRLLGKSTQR